MAAASELAKSLCTFSASLYENILTAQNGKQVNTLVCPLSIYTALAMTLAGSKASTEEELRQAMHLTSPVKHDELGSFLQSYLKSSDGFELNSANRMFLLRLAKINGSFKKELEKDYNSECESLASLSSDEARRTHINEWVGKITQERIMGLLPSGAINPQSIIMLVNALFFKGSWANQFPVANTKAGKFQKHDGSQIEIQMMRTSHHFPYEEPEEFPAQALKLPFQGNSSLEMLIVLPFGHDGLPEIQQHLQKPENLQKLLSLNFNEQKVDVHLPKFKLAKCPLVDVVSTLKKMGVNKLFDQNNCDLSGISDDMKLFVSAIYHQSVLEVDEKGATAAASTAMRISNRSLIRDPIFKADRPFFVAIVRDKTIPIFLGHVWEPEPF